MSSSHVLAAITLAAAGFSVQADVVVRFVESAPKDRFVVTNAGECALTNLKVAIDLGDSAGGLIFDTTGAGAGVEVFQPFEVRSGELALASASVSDGDTALIVSVSELPMGESASFTIDVDDTLRNSALGQIRVAGAEIAGAVVTVEGEGDVAAQAVFGNDSHAHVAVAHCAA